MRISDWSSDVCSSDLFSRDTIALSTAVALSHGMFEGAALLGICDKIVPGLLIGALRFGHLPTILVPAGPMPSGLANKEKQRVRRSEEHTSELQSLMRISYAVFCLKKKKTNNITNSYYFYSHQHFILTNI